MKKILFSILLFIVILPVYAIDLNINSKSAILYNLNDDEVLYEKDSQERLSIASLTKIVTAITIIENSNLDDEVLINYNMLKNLDGYARIWLSVGDKLTVEELLYATMLPSAADAAQSLAIYKSGSIEEFANLMNDEVKKIGATNSHFTNPVGMDDEDNYSTASDLGLILKYALKNDTFKAIYESDEYYIKSLKRTVYKTTSTRGIDTSIIKGSKTGFTYDAGRCLTSTAYIDGVEYLFVNLGAREDTLDYINDALNIYDYYSSNYSYKDIVNKDDKLYTLKIKHSKEKEYDIVSHENISKYLENDFDKKDVNIIYDGVEYIEKSIKLGDKIGEVSFKYNDEVLYIMDVFLDKEIKYYNYVLYISIILIVILGLFILKKKRKKRKKVKTKH